MFAALGTRPDIPFLRSHVFLTIVRTRLRNIGVLDNTFFATCKELRQP